MSGVLSRQIHFWLTALATNGSYGTEATTREYSATHWEGALATTRT